MDFAGARGNRAQTYESRRRNRRESPFFMYFLPPADSLFKAFSIHRYGYDERSSEVKKQCIDFLRIAAEEFAEELEEVHQAGLTTEDFEKKVVSWEKDPNGILNKIEDADFYVLAHVYKIDIVLHFDERGVNADAKRYVHLNKEPTDAVPGADSAGAVAAPCVKELHLYKHQRDGHVDLLIPKLPGRGGVFNVAQSVLYQTLVRVVLDGGGWNELKACDVVSVSNEYVRKSQDLTRYADYRRAALDQLDAEAPLPLRTCQGVSPLVFRSVECDTFRLLRRMAQPGMPDENGLSVGQYARFDVRDIVECEKDDEAMKQFPGMRHVTGIIQVLPPRAARDTQNAEVLLTKTQKRVQVPYKALMPMPANQFPAELFEHARGPAAIAPSDGDQAASVPAVSKTEEASDDTPGAEGKGSAGANGTTVPCGDSQDEEPVLDETSETQDVDEGHHAHYSGPAVFVNSNYHNRGRGARFAGGERGGRRYQQHQGSYRNSGYGYGGGGGGRGYGYGQGGGRRYDDQVAAQFWRNADHSVIEGELATSSIVTSLYRRPGDPNRMYMAQEQRGNPWRDGAQFGGYTPSRRRGGYEASASGMNEVVNNFQNMSFDENANSKDDKYADYGGGGGAAAAGYLLEQQQQMWRHATGAAGLIPVVPTSHTAAAVEQYQFGGYLPQAGAPAGMTPMAASTPGLLGPHPFPMVGALPQVSFGAQNFDQHLQAQQQQQKPGSFTEGTDQHSTEFPPLGSPGAVGTDTQERQGNDGQQDPTSRPSVWNNWKPAPAALEERQLRSGSAASDDHQRRNAQRRPSSSDSGAPGPQQRRSFFGGSGPSPGVPGAPGVGAALLASSPPSHFVYPDMRSAYPQPMGGQAAVAHPYGVMIPTAAGPIGIGPGGYGPASIPQLGPFFPYMYGSPGGGYGHVPAPMPQAQHPGAYVPPDESAGYGGQQRPSSSSPSDAPTPAASGVYQPQMTTDTATTPSGGAGPVPSVGQPAQTLLAAAPAGPLLSQFPVVPSTMGTTFYPQSLSSQFVVYPGYQPAYVAPHQFGAAGGMRN